VLASNDISISVETEFLRQFSDIAQKRYAFAYLITITNNSKQPTTLLTRHWIITDADGNVQEVHGAGVVGEQPLIYPGKYFRYSSGAILATPIGSMQGSYTMMREDGCFFDALIPPFSLQIPELVN
jgi:ApaG protein